MTREDIIRIYNQVSDELCGGKEWAWTGVEEPLQRFAALVAAMRDARACRIVYGLCASDNEAQRIVDAIKKEDKT
jgi:hypothetical protein